MGQVVFTADDAEEWHAQGKAVILVSQFPCHLGSKSCHQLTYLSYLSLVFPQ